MNPIDVREVIARFDGREHARRADAYFAGLSATHPVARKPWASPQEAPEIAAGIGAILSGLELFHGARVLDFGCGTGWMGRLLSDLGCRVTSMDVSQRALDLAAEIESRTAHEKGRIAYSRYEGDSLGLEDGAFDRIVCFDAFHHVPNPGRVLQEMHRVLAPGGIAAFHEPGPRHSLTEQSQFEMRQYEVIENDVVIEQIRDDARRAGFTDLRLAFAPPRPVFLEVEEFTRLVEGGDDALARSVLDSVRAQFSNLRIFFLRKPGAAAADSRAARGLRHAIDVLSVGRRGEAAEVEARVRNTGTAAWLPSGHIVGAVNLGVQRMGADGSRGLDYHRVMPFEHTVPPGAEVTLRFTFPLAEPGDSYVLDLVAEGVAWFGNYGALPKTVAP